MASASSAAFAFAASSAARAAAAARPPWAASCPSCLFFAHLSGALLRVAPGAARGARFALGVVEAALAGGPGRCLVAAVTLR